MVGAAKGLGRAEAGKLLGGADAGEDAPIGGKSREAAGGLKKGFFHGLAQRILIRSRERSKGFLAPFGILDAGAAAGRFQNAENARLPFAKGSAGKEGPGDALEVVEPVMAGKG